MREVDLHGLTWQGSLEEFEAECRRALEQSGGAPSKIRVIHGYGSEGEGGVLRDRLRAFCDRFDDCLEYTRGRGHRRQQGRDRRNGSEAASRCVGASWRAFLEYCRNGRTTSEIEGFVGQVRPWRGKP